MRSLKVSIQKKFFKGRVILCSKNNSVKTINSKVLKHVIGERNRTIQSDLTGSTVDCLSEEYLCSLTTSGFPPAKLELNVGLPAMLLRNLNLGRGLCNGTGIIIHHIGRYVLHVKL